MYEVRNLNSLSLQTSDPRLQTHRTADRKISKLMIVSELEETTSPLSEVCFSPVSILLIFLVN